VARVLTVEFGPSASKRFQRAVAEAESGAGECSELGPGRYRVRFLLDRDPQVFAGLARLLQRVRAWRASEVYEGGRLVSSSHAGEMGWCASAQLGWFGECRFRFFYGVYPRCALCPLFEVERAVLDVLWENTPPIAAPLDPNWRISDSIPREWRQQLGEEPPDDW
jgi:hypothetical protein